MLALGLKGEQETNELGADPDLPIERGTFRGSHFGMHGLVCSRYSQHYSLGDNSNVASSYGTSIL